VCRASSLLSFLLILNATLPDPPLVSEKLLAGHPEEGGNESLRKFHVNAPVEGVEVDSMQEPEQEQGRVLMVAHKPL